MKSISKLVAACAITIATVSIVSCKKGDTGPAGPAGPAGAQGPQGVQGLAGPTGQNGNANVMQYIFAPLNPDTTFAGIKNFTKPSADSAYVGLLVTVLNDTADKAAWFTYLYRGGVWYAVPGAGKGDSSTYSFSYGYIDYTLPLDSCAFFIDRVTGKGEVYDAIRIVRILISGTATGSTNGGKYPGLPNIDFNNYLEVKKYYNLP